MIDHRKWSLMMVRAAPLSRRTARVAFCWWRMHAGFVQQYTLAAPSLSFTFPHGVYFRLNGADGLVNALRLLVLLDHGDERANLGFRTKRRIAGAGRAAHDARLRDVLRFYSSGACALSKPMKMRMLVNSFADRLIHLIGRNDDGMARPSVPVRNERHHAKTYQRGARRNVI